MFKSKNKIIIVFISLSLLVVLFLVANKKTENSVPPPFSSPYIGVGRVEVSPPINTPPPTSNFSLKDDIPGDISVYDFMSKMRNEGKINFVEKNYIGMGEFITEINGVKNNNSQSWIYYVNGKEASVGVSNYKISPGDIVSFKYEKSNY